MATETSLQQELCQTKPFRSPAQEGVGGLLFTADLVRRSLSEVVERQGLTLQQYNVLRILRGAGKEGLPTLQIADRMLEKTPGLTGLLDRLEKKALVRRKRCTEDRRRVYCKISSRGSDLLGELDAPIEACENRLAWKLSDRQMMQLVRLHAALRHGCRKDPEVAPEGC